MAREPEIVAAHREELIALLTEAAEIEHGLMCCYLYAAFSLKTTDDAGLAPARLEATRRWRATIMDVAIEEMMHLGLVANLMSAIGARPHFGRQNFPVSPGFHPASVVVELRRFSKETVEHFVFLERPEGVELPDGEGFASARRYERAMDEGALLPTAQDFHTVGHLYRSIEAGFDHLAATLGEEALFIGAPAGQMDPETSGFPQLVRVADLRSAKAAIEAIVEQGEGAPGHAENGHFARFVAVRDELASLVAADPAFDPAWPSARNPVLRAPPEPSGRLHVTNPEARRLLDVANSAYGLMLRCLMAAFGQPDATAQSRAIFYGAAIEAMQAIVPIAERLARLAAIDSQSQTAGLTFTLPRSVGAVATSEIARRVTTERARELAAASAKHGAALPILADAAPRFERIAASLAQADFASAAPAPEPAPNVVPKSPTDAGDGNDVEVAVGANVVIRFDGKKCIHSRFCVLQAPTVFKANTPGAWIFPDAMDADRLIAVAELCPSGAITYERRDGGSGESAPPVNVVRLRENGPYAFHAAIDVAGRRVTRATLCRCGASKNKPYCDGSHNAIGFAASGEPATRASEPLHPRDGALAVSPQSNGPLVVSGALEICSGTGRTVDRVTGARLCRCGGSANKPFCDGTHARIGFRSDS